MLLKFAGVPVLYWQTDKQMDRQTERKTESQTEDRWTETNFKS